MNKFITLASFLIAISNLQAQTLVLMEDFQAGIPNSWTILNEDGKTPAMAVQEYDEAWISKADPDSSSNNTASATSFFNSSGQANRWLISPALIMGDYGNAVSWKAKSHDASFPDDYVVLFSKTGTAKTDFLDTIFFIQGENGDWTERKVNLSNQSLDNQTIYIAFVLNTTDGFKLYIDDFTVTQDDAAKVTENTNDITIANLGEGRYLLPKSIEKNQLQIFDIQGKKLSFSEENNVLTIDQKGLFFVQGISNNQPFSIKIIH
jgi:hypothetical protein